MSNDTLQRLSGTIEARKNAAPESSYVAKLFSKGDDAILKKVIEEAGEVLLAAKDGDRQHRCTRWRTCGFTAWCCWRTRA